MASRAETTTMIIVISGGVTLLWEDGAAESGVMLPARKIAPMPTKVSSWTASIGVIFLVTLATQRRKSAIHQLASGQKQQRKTTLARAGTAIAFSLQI